MGARALVFLDFDDVISITPAFKGSTVVRAFQKNELDSTPDLWVKIFDCVLCTNLRALHDEFGPRYVISSSWAAFLDRDQVAELLNRTGLDFVAAHLHDDWCTPRSPGSERADEIAGWLAAHNGEAGLAFVVLDDLVSGKSLKGSHLEANAVLCDAWRGFTYPKLRTAQKILRAQLAAKNEGS